eukprot:UN23065
MNLISVQDSKSFVVLSELYKNDKEHGKAECCDLIRSCVSQVPFSSPDNYPLSSEAGVEDLTVEKLKRVFHDSLDVNSTNTKNLLLLYSELNKRNIDHIWSQTDNQESDCKMVQPEKHTSMNNLLSMAQQKNDLGLVQNILNNMTEHNIEPDKDRMRQIFQKI